MEFILLALLALYFTILLLGTAALNLFIATVYSKSYYDKSETNGSRKWPRFQALLTRLTERFQKNRFNYTIVYKGAEDLEERVALYLSPKEDAPRAIFAANPHGVVAICTLFNVITPLDPKWLNITVCIHQYIFAVPVLRDIALWVGAIDVTRENIIERLKTHSVYILPGGCKEMIIDFDDPIQSYHKGFLRIAFEEKKPVFPVLHIGQEDVFPSYSTGWLDRKIRMPVQEFIGYPFPTFFSLFPFKSDLTTYVFEPHLPEKYNDIETFIDDYYIKVKEMYSTVRGKKKRPLSVTLSL
jgi:1-acyl-sn-glycerol-3-phosphate acyltransferase